MAYHDNEYKPDSPKKITAKKEELIVPPNFISTPEQSTQQRAIEKAVAESMKIKPTVLSSKRSAFLNKGVKQRLSGGSVDCSDSCVVLSTGHGFGTSDDLFITNLSSGSTVQYSHAMIENGEIAKFGNKFWIHVHGNHEFREFELNSNCTATYIRTISIDPSMYSSSIAGVSTVNGLTAKDANTLIIGSVDGDISTQPSTGTLMEVDISGSIAVFTTLFQTGYINGDLVYVPSSNTIATIEAFGTGLGLGCIHYSYSGTILGQVPVSGLSLVAMFCYDGKVIVNSNAGTKWFDLDNYTIQSYPLNIINAGDQASSPECCDEAISTGCYNIGDIGPEGGIIFSVPGVGPNTSTDTYYEVAQDDIALGGTPDAGFNATCGEQPHPFSAWMRVGPFSNGVAQGYATVSLTTANTVSNGWEVDWLYLPPGTTIIAVVLGSNFGILYFSNPFHWAALPISPSGAGSPFLPPLYAGFGYYNIAGNWIANQVNTSGNPPDYPFPTFSPPAGGGITGWSLIGAEWGVHNKPNITTSTDFGTGSKNTDAIDAYPLLPGNPTGGINPWLDTHDIAATLCKQHGFTNDWFLPSRDEFTEMMNHPLVVSQLGLNPLGQNSEHIYWTSSQWRQDPLNPIPDPDKYSWVVDSNGVASLAYRCHALSVRPIRKFECVPTPPCDGDPSCIEYNYRDGWVGMLHGSAGLWCIEGHSGYAGNPIGPHLPIPSQYNFVDWYSTPEFTGNPSAIPSYTTNYNANYWGYSTIGADTQEFLINGIDVVGNRYSNADLSNAVGGEFFITMWDARYNYMGKWRYEVDNVKTNANINHNYDPGSPQYNSSSMNYVGFEPDPTNPSSPSEHHILQLKNGTHVDGEYPQIVFDNPTSTGGSYTFTGAFWKIDWSDAISFENGSNAGIFGGQQTSNPPWIYNTSSNITGGWCGNFPAYCGKGHSLSTGITSGDWILENNVFARHATFPPVDESGNVLTVHPDPYTAGLPTNASAHYLPWHYYNGIPVDLLNLCSGRPPITNHCWSICGVMTLGGNWFAVPDPWFNGQPYGPIAMENNPFGTTPPPFSSNPYVDQDFTDFYDWMLTQSPSGIVAIGDSFVFQQPGYYMQFNIIDQYGNVVTSSLVTSICFKYRGVHNYVQPLGIINDGYPSPVIHYLPCCVGGSSSFISLTRPTENNPDSIKISVDKTFSPSVFGGLSSKRIEFLSEVGGLDDFMVQNNIGPSLTLPTEELPSIQFNDTLPPIDILPLAAIDLTSIVQPEQQRIIPFDEPEEETPPPPRRDTGY